MQKCFLESDIPLLNFTIVDSKSYNLLSYNSVILHSETLLSLDIFSIRKCNINSRVKYTYSKFYNLRF